MKPEGIRHFEDALYHEAIDPLPRATDGSYCEADGIEALARLIRIDLEQEKAKRAAKIIKDRSKPDATEPGGLLVLMSDEYAYEPDRLIRYGEDRIVENSKALVEAKFEANERLRESVNRQTVWLTRGDKEARHFALWTVEETRKGRPTLELTWGNCVAETGIIKP